MLCIKYTARLFRDKMCRVHHNFVGHPSPINISYQNFKCSISLKET